MAALTFYGGTNEVGGNKVLLEDRDTKIWLDFGESFSCGKDYFVDWLKPRIVAGVKDYLEFNLLPKLRGLYSRQALRFTDLRYEDPAYDAVLISHCHRDHIAHIEFLDERIPIYLGETTKLILDAWSQSSPIADFGEHDYRTFRTGDKLRIGSIEVEPVHVDHSVPGAYGFILHTSEGSVVYTGDLRMHGPRSDMTRDFIEAAREAEPSVMICEGTRVAPSERRRNLTEEDVKLESEKIAKGARELVMVTFYGRDIDRLRTFHAVSESTGRKLVISTKAALLLSALKRDKRMRVPDPLKDDNLLVYFKRKKSGEFAEEDYYQWERPFLDKGVDFDYVHRHQARVLLNLDFYDFAELVDIQPDKGGHFIRSMSEPLSEEEIEEEVLRNWLDHFGLHLHNIHASGHCSKEEIAQIIKEIRPKLLLPVHTEYPQLFKKISGDFVERVKIPEPGIKTNLSSKKS